jgi:hypothetical protein
MADQTLTGRVRRAKGRKKDEPLYVRPGTRPQGPNAFQKPLPGRPPGALAPLRPTGPQSPPFLERPDSQGLEITGSTGRPPSQKANEKPDFGEIRKAHEGLRGRLQRIKQDYGANREPAEDGKEILRQEITPEEQEHLERLRLKLMDLRHARQDFPDEFADKTKSKKFSTAKAKKKPLSTSLTGGWTA